MNLVLEYIPETVYKVDRQYAKNKQTIPINYIRVSFNCANRFVMYNIEANIELHYSSTCTNCFEVSLISTHWASAIVT